MPAAITDKITKTFNSVNPNVARVTASRSSGVTTLQCDNLAGWPTDTKVHFSTYALTSGGAVDTATQIDWSGIVSGNNIGTLTRLAGATDNGNAINDIVEMNPTASWANDLATHILTQHNQDGSHKSVTTDTLTTTGNVTIGGTLTISGSTSTGGWSPISGTISAVTYNGQRSYDLTTSNDNTTNITPGMRLRTTRTVSAPTQCTSLNGTTQYYSKSSPAGMTFTDDFVVSAWVKLSSYGASDINIASRYNGTSGWRLAIDSTGRVVLSGANAGSSNVSYVASYQSVPLNRWIHIAAQLDMSSFTATSTTSYIMIDGVDVPCTVVRGGTNPTALVQAGNLEIGSTNSGTLLFPGKIAQVAIYNAKVTQANIRATISQGLVGNETSLISAYSFSNSINDLNTTNANNLTANGSAVATNADSPFGGQAGGSISSTLDYMIVTKITSTTITGVVPEGCTIPTTGGVSACSYAGDAKPYGMPTQSAKWQLVTITLNRTTKSSPTASTTYNFGDQLTIPTGEWNVGYRLAPYVSNSSSATLTVYTDLNASAVTGTWPSSTGASLDKKSDFAVSTYMNAITEHGCSHYVRMPLSLSSNTQYWLNAQCTNSAGTLSALGPLSDFSKTVIFAESAYL